MKIVLHKDFLQSSCDKSSLFFFYVDAVMGLNVIGKPHKFIFCNDKLKSSPTLKTEIAILNATLNEIPVNQ